MLIIIGDINVDINLALSHWPQEGGDAIAHTTTWSNGGTGLNSATAVARMGDTPQLWGRVGTDPAAHQLITTAQHYGIDVAAIQTDMTVPTGLCVIPVSPNGERTFLSYRGANTHWQIPSDWPDGTHWLHVCGHALLSDTQRHSTFAALHEAQRRGWHTSVDLCEAFASQLDELRTHLRHPLHVLLGNRDEMRIVHQYVTHPMHEYAHTIITKLGAAGCSAVTASDTYTSAGFTVDTIDTTACGDTFASVCVWVLMHRHPLAEALLVANAAGALTASRRGAADITPTRTEVIALLAHQRGHAPAWLSTGFPD